MEIKTKWNIGDKIYYFIKTPDLPAIKKGKIEVIVLMNNHLEKEGVEEETIRYIVDRTSGSLKEHNQLASSVEELLAKIKVHKELL